MQSESRARLTAMVELATTDPDIAILAEELDRDIWLLNCTNGTLNLRDGTFRPAAKEDLITKTTGVPYEPEAACPEFLTFVNWAMTERQDLVTFLQRALGYSLTGDVSERVLFLLHGEGRNGKSTLLKTVRAVMGDYAKRVASQTFEKTRSGGNTAGPDQAQLKGQRFIYTSEIEDGTQLATAMMKDFTGDEPVSARMLYKAPFEFMPEFKPWIAANHMPKVPTDDQAIWDRIRLIPFDARISDEDKDPTLGERLRAEAPGILAWMVRGCQDWRRHGLGTPAAVVEAGEEYREEMDTFRDFLDYLDELEEVGRDVDMGRQSLHNTYMKWAKGNDAPALNIRAFKAKMAAKGFEQKGSNYRWVRTSLPEVDREALIAKFGLAQGPWVREHHNVLITGPTGCGKSFLACALANSAIRQGHTALYARTPRLVDDLALGRADGRYARLLAQLARVSVLVLDDFLLSPAPVEACRDLLEVVEDRAGLRSTVVASQVPTDKWHPSMADPTLADAVVDRLFQASHRIAMKGASMRKRQPPSAT